FIVIAAGCAALIRVGVIHAPYIISLPFLAIVAAMAYELNCDVLRVRRDLDERLRLEGLVAAVGAAFVNVTPYRVNEEIERWMQRMIVTLDVDRIVLFEFTTDHTQARNTHQVAREGVPRLAREFSYDQLPWYLGELCAGRSVVLSDLTKELPAQAIAEREFARERGTRAVMGFPLMVSGVIVRGINCVRVHKARVWSEAAQNTLRLIGQIFAHALAEQQAEQDLSESEERMSLAAEAANLALWEWNPNTDELWGSKTRRALLGLPASGKLTLQDTISRVVHVDDRDRLLQTLKDAAATGKDYEC